MVPLTLGSRKRDHDETSLVIIFASNDLAEQDQNANSVMTRIDKVAEVELVKTRRIMLEVSTIAILWHVGMITCDLEKGKGLI